jgi:phosphate/sulfate permease
MKTVRIISVILLVGIGLAALLGDLLDKDDTFGFILSFVVTKFMGIILLYIAYLLIRGYTFNDEYLDDDMDRLA